MSLMTFTPEYDNLIADYAAGYLSPAKHMLVSCYMEMNKDRHAECLAYEDVSASLMANSTSVDLSDDFMRRALAALPARETITEDENATSHDVAAPGYFNTLGFNIHDTKWRKVTPGISIKHLMRSPEKNGERVFLFKLQGGQSMPQHSHSGQEWTLVLSGSYKDDGVEFNAGDLQIEDGSTYHAPVIESSEECICLALTEGPLKIRPLLPRMLQPLLGL